MAKHPGSQLTQHLAEALTLAICWEAQDPPNPITRAALQSAMQDLIAELNSLVGNPPTAHARQ